jgi:1,2-diacylglycerol-3-alpha-glucose alpha-1,2-galactosyltransferase
MKKKKIIVDMISESEFTVQGHGVHTAHREMVESLSRRNDVEVYVNGRREDTGEELRYRDKKADIIHLQTFGFYALWKMVFSRGAKRVISVHVVPKSLIGSIILAKYWSFAARWHMRNFYGAGDMLLACSGMVAEALTEELSLPKDKVKVFYNTVNMKKYASSEKERAATRKKLGYKPDDFIVIGNGQLQPRKRIDAFVEAAKALPDVKFVWVGGVPFKSLAAEKDKVERIVKSAPENVKFPGLVPIKEVGEYLKAADAFFLPAEQENHPMAVLEAAGAGLPIVLRDLKEYDDTFRGDALFGEATEDFVEIIEKLKKDKDFYKKSVAGARNIAERFDSAAGAERLAGLYREIMSEK